MSNAFMPIEYLTTVCVCVFTCVLKEEKLREKKIVSRFLKKTSQFFKYISIKKFWSRINFRLKYRDPGYIIIFVEKYIGDGSTRYFRNQWWIGWKISYFSMT